MQPGIARANLRYERARGNDHHLAPEEAVLRALSETVALAAGGGPGCMGAHRDRECERRAPRRPARRIDRRARPRRARPRASDGDGSEGGLPPDPAGGRAAPRPVTPAALSLLTVR